MGNINFNVPSVNSQKVSINDESSRKVIENMPIIAP